MFSLAFILASLTQAAFPSRSPYIAAGPSHTPDLENADPRQPWKQFLALFACICAQYSVLLCSGLNLLPRGADVSPYFLCGGVKFGCPESISGMGHTHIALSLFGRMPTHGGHALHVAVNVKRHRAVSIRRVYSVCTRLAHKIRQTILIYMP